MAPAWMAPLQALVENALPSAARGGFIGLIGDHPSTYARSPRLWAPALAALDIDATYLPLDVPDHRLVEVVEVLRRTEACLGANVTVPHKEAVVPLLDEIDPVAAAIGAVNTIVRTPKGRLAGANTDGVGLVAALLEPGGDGPLVQQLEGMTVLLIGAGGAARAAALALAPLLGPGELLVANRRYERARAIAERVSAQGGRALAVPEGALDARLPAVGLVINASVRGQAGIWKGPRGWTCLEPYSALAPASPAVLSPMPEDEFFAAWSAQSARDIEANHAVSRSRVRRLAVDARVYDMIYAPPETTTLTHAREAGLRTANGWWMNIAQGVAACVDHICRSALAARGVDPEAARADVTRVMARAWDG